MFLCKQEYERILDCIAAMLHFVSFGKSRTQCEIQLKLVSCTMCHSKLTGVSNGKIVLGLPVSYLKANLYWLKLISLVLCFG